MSDKKKPEFVRQKNFYELSMQTQRDVLVKMFTDAGHDLSKWYFNIKVEHQELTIKDLEDACQTAIATENYEKAALIRDVINRKKNETGQCKN